MSDYGYWADDHSEITQEDLEERFDIELNDGYDWPEIGGIRFAPSDILRELDPIAYRVGLSDFHSELADAYRIVEELDDEEV